MWDGVQGKFGVGKSNESGESLVSFCAFTQLCVMNTMFDKKRIQQYTRQHPGTKNWHCIDYVLMCQSQRYCCTDVTVLRSAQCWTITCYCVLLLVLSLLLSGSHHIDIIDLMLVL